MTVLPALFALLVAQATPSPAPAGVAPSPAAPAISPPMAAASATPAPVSPSGQTPPASPGAGSPSPGGSPLPGAAPPATQSPVPGLSPAPSLSPSAGASPAPVAAPTATPSASPFHYRFVPHVNPSAAPGEPQIYEVDLNDRVLRSRGAIDIRVVTNPEVNKVVSRGNGRGGTVPQVAPGEFVTHSTLPAIPFIASGMTVNLQFVAYVPDGRSTTVTVPVRLR
ncbi:MAG: hypothetical protein ACLPYS_15345 [Vulcanimicrobiaceae bacterium]